MQPPPVLLLLGICTPWRAFVSEQIPSGRLFAFLTARQPLCAGYCALLCSAATAGTAPRWATIPPSQTQPPSRCTICVWQQHRSGSETMYGWYQYLMSCRRHLSEPILDCDTGVTVGRPFKSPELNQKTGDTQLTTALWSQINLLGVFLGQTVFFLPTN